MPLSPNAIQVLESRYLNKNREGKMLETPSQLFHRVAKAIAKAELVWGSKNDVAHWEKEFFTMMSDLYFLPNSPTLMNAGNNLNQLSACFVLPVGDSIESIFNTLKNVALIQQSGGGTGFNFSHLRQKGDFISTTSGEASGPISFMKIYDASTENIKQGGKRRGANMGILNIDHPDIEEFISVKRNNHVLTNFNISVGVTNDFMLAVIHDKGWQLVHPKTKEVVKKIKAKKLWKEIIENAWFTGDPGIIFLDEINAKNPTPRIGKIESTNPCGEVPLMAYEPCNLGSINLAKLILKKKGKGKKIPSFQKMESLFDWKKFEEIIFKSIRFLDDVIEVNNYVLPEIKKMSFGNRKIGLGVMGWADMLIQLEIPYDSDEAIELAEELMKFINEKSFEASVQLATERGAFLNWKKSIYSPKTKVRNATRTSIAPTGTISIIADCSSSIEPLFALAYKREHVLNEQTLYETNKHFVEYLKKERIYSEKLIEKVRHTGSVKYIKEIPEKIKSIFKTSFDMDYTWHIKHQIAFQKYCDNAVSKTINLPNEATIADIEKAYRFAWQMGAKGITVYRYGSKGTQVLNVQKENGEPMEMSEIKACKVCSD